MTGFNRVVLLGNVTRDPDIRKTASGIAVGDIGIATNEVYRNKDGEKVEKTCFVDVVVWGRQAETCGQYLTKGRCVLIEGRLQLDRWEDKDGQKRSRLRVRCDTIQFLGGRRHEEDTHSEEQDAAPDPMPF